MGLVMDWISKVNADPMGENSNKMAEKQTSYSRIINPGKVLVDYGPITMLIEANREDQPFTKAAAAGGEVAVYLLGELAANLFIARQAISELDPARDSTYPEVLRRMVVSVRRLGEADFTPMAAVAGTFSDLVKEAVLTAQADSVMVNNGGDIALHLRAGGDCLRVGIVRDLSEGRITHALKIYPDQGIYGIATSGLGGRSLTKGIASAVTVLAEDGSLADAAATAIANAVNCDDSVVERCLAEELDPSTDIRGHLVTRRVGRLSMTSIETAFAQGLERFRQLYREGMIKGVVIFIQGQVRMFPDNLAHPLA
jgi:ApbE superfamily uncharacterized protein (UPF0280 family)